MPGQGLKGEGGVPAREASEKMGGAEGQDMPEAGGGVVPEGAAHMSKVRGAGANEGLLRVQQLERQKRC